MNIKNIFSAIMLVLLLTALWGFWFLVPEGHIGVKTRFSKAIDQVEPGLNFKLPIIDGVKKIEVRERRSVEDLAAATGNQLPTTVKVSINWTVSPDAALDLYQRYGGLSQFEDRILDPKLRQASKAAISKYNADELIRDRNAVTAVIQENMVNLMAAYPVTVNSPQIENIELPPAYLDAVLQKEQAREGAAREKYNLEKQGLEAQQIVQTANADRDAAKSRADGEAYKIIAEATAHAESVRLRGQAEAEAIDLVQDALSDNPLLVQYEQAKRWNGTLPSTMLPGGAVPFINVQ